MNGGAGVLRTYLWILTLSIIITEIPSCQRIRTGIVNLYTFESSAEEPGDGLQPEFSGADLKRERIRVTLRRVVSGFDRPTDIAFVPGHPDLMVVLEKEGRMRWADIPGGKKGTLLTLKVLTDSEQGLLGIAFHPNFVKNGRFYLNHSIEKGGKKFSRVSGFACDPAAAFEACTPRDENVLLEVEQPYSNHNGGRLDFGPDGMLYIGWGDGGWRGDPHGNGQNPLTMLGSMLRIDVNGRSGGRQYSIPPDNPFLNRRDALPEVWAYGLRNPWKYSFSPDGRLIAADVGQDEYEEIDIITRGGNYGWNIREGMHCYSPSSGCRTEGLVDPVYEYSHEEGQSITGGTVYTGQKITGLKGKYVFADFVQGRIWAISLPAGGDRRPVSAYALGKWPLMISTFGRDHSGEIYVADFASGAIYRIE